MAIINSMGVGRSKKSMGNVTYRVIRGRTIGSQKRASGATGAITRGQRGNYRKPLFAMINMFMAAHASDIEVSFNKSRYGSQRNYFFKLNYTALSRALTVKAVEVSSSGILPTISEVEAIITEFATANPNEILRVRLNGFEDIYMSGAWSSENNPISGGATDGLGFGNARTVSAEFVYEAPTAMSLNFHAGARIVRAAGNVVITGDAIAGNITAAQIKYLTTGGNVLEKAVTLIESKGGSIAFEAPEITVTDNALAVLVGQVYVRLSSAYVRTSSEETDPLGRAGSQKSKSRKS